MTPITREWVDKAEADYTIALLARRSRKKSSRDIVCFHLQQCMEKYIKGRMVEVSIPFPKIHDLEKLLDLVLPIEPLWAAYRGTLATLSNAAVKLRYPGNSISAADASNW